jgi:hypothetical protein
MRLWLKAPIFLVLLSAHFTRQFVARAEAHAIRPSEHAHLVWSILSAPLFFVLPESGI